MEKNAESKITPKTLKLRRNPANLEKPLQVITEEANQFQSNAKKTQNAFMRFKG